MVNKLRKFLLMWLGGVAEETVTELINAASKEHAASAIGFAKELQAANEEIAKLNAEINRFDLVIAQSEKTGHIIINGVSYYRDTQTHGKVTIN